MRRTRRRLARLPAASELGLLLALVLAPAAGAAAGGPDASIEGTLLWKGADGVARPAVALSTDVEIRVSGLVARAVVRQRFANTSDLWLEGVYVFPLPEMAAVDRMRLRVGERRIEGRIAERAEAVRVYTQAKRSGRTASLLEQERPNLFTTSVANVGPGETVEVEIAYQHTVHYARSGFELRFPMTITARYVPGLSGSEGVAGAPAVAAPGTGWGRATPAVPDAARITPPLLAPGGPTERPLDLRVVLDAGVPLARVESPTHPIRVRAMGEGRREVRLRGVPADRDFVLRWAPVPGHEPRAALFSETYDGEHYALLMVLPPDADDAETGPVLARDAVFVVDTSGSMGGTSIVQARAALHQALDRLRPDDTFNVIAFADRPDALFEGPVPASPSALRRAHAFVGALRASGGTEMLAALERALRDPARPSRGDGDRLRQVILLTDASIGNETRLFDAIRRDLGRSRLFLVGIGSAPNAYFLSRAATLGRGTATLIGSPAEVRERMEELAARIETPVLGDLEVHWNDEVETWPARIPDLYAGEPLLVAARLRRFVGDVVLVGRRDGRPFQVRLPLTPGGTERGIHKLWARRKIAHWMMQRGTGVDPARIREEVLAVALEHQILSRYTSLVAVDTTPRRPRSAPGATTNVPLQGPAGFDPSLVPGVLPQGATSAPLLLWGGVAALALAAGLAGAPGRAGRCGSRRARREGRRA